MHFGKKPVKKHHMIKCGDNRPDSRERRNGSTSTGGSRVRVEVVETGSVVGLEGGNLEKGKESEFNCTWRDMNVQFVGR